MIKIILISSIIIFLFVLTLVIKNPMNTFISTTKQKRVHYHYYQIYQKEWWILLKKELYELFGNLNSRQSNTITIDEESNLKVETVTWTIESIDKNTTFIFDYPVFEMWDSKIFIINNTEVIIRYTPDIKLGVLFEIPPSIEINLFNTTFHQTPNYQYNKYYYQYEPIDLKEKKQEYLILLPKCINGYDSLKIKLPTYFDSNMIYLIIAKSFKEIVRN